MHILLIADCPPIANHVTTGFGRVSHHVAKALHPHCQLDFLAVNYYGGPHDSEFNLFPMAPNDPLGFRELESLLRENKYDAILGFNDIWVLNTYWRIIAPEKVPFYSYFPVDCIGWGADLVRYCSDWAGVATYTRFGADVVKKAGYTGPVEVIPHGVDTSAFKHIPTAEARKRLFGEGKMVDDFIVLNANRNTHRKRVGLTIEAFNGFLADAHDGGKKALWLHMGDPDVGIPIREIHSRTAKIYGLDSTSIPTLLQSGTGQDGRPPTQQPDVPVEILNLIYAAADVTINTAIGEGWGLCPVEALFAGTPAIVGRHSVHEELWGDGRGYLVDPVGWDWGTTVELTPMGAQQLHGLRHPIQAAYLYTNALHQAYLAWLTGELKNVTARAQAHFRQPEFSWPVIEQHFRDWLGVETVEPPAAVSQEGTTLTFRDGTWDEAIYQQVHDQNEYHIGELQPEDIVIDVGAHVGSFSILAHDLGSREIYAFEANPENAAIAAANIGTRGKLINAAVWGHKREPLLFHGSHDAWNTGGGNVWGEEGQPIEVLDFNEFLEALGDRPIRLLKLDCEASEYSILYECRHLNQIQEIVLEYHWFDHVPATYEGYQLEQLNGKALLEFLQGQGFEAEIQNAHPSGLGKIFAQRPQPAE